MKRISIATSLALSALTFAPPPAKAAPPQFTTETVQLLNWFESVGGTVHINGPKCDVNRAYGIASNSTVWICQKLHVDPGNLADTVRHELWHIAQFCNTGVILDQHDPAVAISVASDHGWEAGGYQPGHWHMEAEAHTAAAVLDEGDIKQAITKYCLS